MENSRKPDKQAADTLQHTQFSPTPTQPSPNTTRPLEPPSHFTQASTTQLPPMPPPPFPNLDNLPPFSNQPTSSQYPLFTQTSNISHSSPYVRIVADEHNIPLSQTRPDNASTSIPQPPQQQCSYGAYSGEFGNGEDEYDGYENQSGRQVMNTENLERYNTGFGFAERVNQGTFGYQQTGQPINPMNQQPGNARPANIPMPYPVQQVPIQPRPLPRNIVPPVNNFEGIPRRYDQGPVRGIESHFKPAIANNPSPVVIPQLHGRSFEVRAQSIQSLPKYHGLATEEPYLHIAAYDARCNTIGGQGFTSDDVKLVLFQFTLEGKAQQWFHTLPSASIFTWPEMQQLFLDEFYTPQRTNDARKDIRNFQQQPGELFHESFNRFKMLLKNCPHHGIQMWELMNAFHEGLMPEDARDLSSISNGTFGTNYEHVD